MELRGGSLRKKGDERKVLRNKKVPHFGDKQKGFQYKYEKKLSKVVVKFPFLGFLPFFKK